MVGSLWLAAIYIGGWILAMRIFGFFWKRRQTGNKNQQTSLATALVFSSQVK